MQNNFFSQLIGKSGLSWQKKNKLLKRFAKSSNNQKRAVWFSFRKELLSDYFDSDLSYFRSPIQNQADSLRLKSSVGEDFTYERGSEYPQIEKEFNNYNLFSNEMNNWEQSPILFNSGMSAISTLLMFIGNSFLPRTRKKILVFGTYFEVGKLLDGYQNLFEVTYASDANDLIKKIRTDNFDVLYIEPIAWDFTLKRIEINLLLSIFSEFKFVKLRFLFLDVTLSGILQFPIGKILKSIGCKFPIVVLEASSLLKMDQFGLELSNGGITMLYSHKKYSSYIDFSQLVQQLKIIRGNSGHSLDMLGMQVFNTRFMHSKVLQNSYANQIKENMLLFINFVESLTENSLDRQHQSLSLIYSIDSCLYNVAPFCLFRLRTNKSKEIYMNLMRQIIKLSRRENIYINVGTSFGFQNTRIDMIEYNKNFSFFIRLSIGAFETNKNIYKLAQITSFLLNEYQVGIRKCGI